VHVILRSKEQNLSKGTAMQCHTTRGDGGCTDQLVGKCQVASKRIADSWSKLYTNCQLQIDIFLPTQWVKVLMLLRISKLVL
jgi:hypothetical protein